MLDLPGLFKAMGTEPPAPAQHRILWFLSEDQVATIVGAVPLTLAILTILAGLASRRAEWRGPFASVIAFIVTALAHFAFADDLKHFMNFADACAMPYFPPANYARAPRKWCCCERIRMRASKHS